MKLTSTPHGWDDYIWWQATDRSVVKRISRRIEDLLRDPHSGIGKPEPLKHALQGAWSRRITDEHRLVYLVEDETIDILQARSVYSSVISSGPGRLPLP